MNLDQIRQDIPGYQDKLFFNSAGSSLSPAVVNQTIKTHLDLEEDIGGYAAMSREQDRVEDFYTYGAQMLQTQKHNIAYAYNATDAYARALSSIPFKHGDVILTTKDDYISNYIAFLSLQKRQGVQLITVRNTSDNEIDLEDMEDQMRQHNPVLVAVTHIPTSSGLVQDVASVGVLCRRYGAWYIVDACQSLGQLPLDVNEIGCDFLSATGRKWMRGPRGTGLLYVSDRALKSGLEPLLIDMRGALWIEKDQYQAVESAQRYELWENNYALILGMSEAMKYAQKIGMENIASYNKILSSKLRDGLRQIDGIHVQDIGKSLCNIVTWSTHDRNLEKISHYLDAHKVFYSVSQRSNAIIDFEEKEIDWAIRFSPHYFNTEAEIDEVLSLISAYK
jgi:cysteine desulfurase / selenocysteine lyase